MPKDGLIENVMSGYYVNHRQGEVLLALDLEAYVLEYTTEIKGLEGEVLDLEKLVGDNVEGLAD